MSSNNNKSSAIGIGLLGFAIGAVAGYYVAKPENQEKFKGAVRDASENFTNRIDQLDYKFDIEPCDERYTWTKEDNSITVDINKKAAEPTAEELENMF